jgi:hypothetical protein
MVDLRPIRGPALVLGDLADDVRSSLGMPSPPFRSIIRTCVQTLEQNLAQAFTLRPTDRVTFSGIPSTGLASRTRVFRYGSTAEHATNGRFVTEVGGLEPRDAQRRLGLDSTRNSAKCIAEGDLLTGSMVHVGPISDSHGGSTGAEQIVVSRDGDIRWKRVWCRPG